MKKNSQVSHFLGGAVQTKTETFPKHTQGARAGRGLNKLHQEVRRRQGGWGHSLDPGFPNVSGKYFFQFAY